MSDTLMFRVYFSYMFNDQLRGPLSDVKYAGSSEQARAQVVEGLKTIGGTDIQVTKIKRVRT